MKVKKFVAKDMPEAMKKIRADLGEEAVILNSKRIVTGGFFGLFTKKKIEVIAAIDEEERQRPRWNEIKHVPPEKQDLKEEVEELKKVVASISSPASLSSQDRLPEKIQQIDQMLSEQEVSPYLREQVVEELLATWYRSDAPTDALLYEKTRDFFIEKMKKLSFGPVTSGPKIIHLVGPTGVGKTTTVAKIAAYYHLEKKQEVAFITTDTYRIAAVDQLKTYAKILNIPVEVAYSPADFQRAIEKFQNKDMIFVDSAGRNFQKQQYVKELQTMIDFNEEMTTYLVLSLTSKYKDMKNIVHQFSHIPIDRFVFTKKDETSTLGAMVNLVTEANKGVAYVTTGQNVPDDIEIADATRIVDWLLEEGRHE